MRLPQTIGDYRFVQRIGQGAFGTVYRCEVRGELGYAQEVAVKLLDAGRAEDSPDLIRSLADEARLLSRLQHPAIVHVRRFRRFSHDALGDTFGLVMELVRGVSVAELLMDQGRFDAVAAVALLGDFADGLRAAHDLQGEDGRPLGLVHRDLKPENILLTREGRVKILDFGIAFAADRLARETAIGLTKGTPLYMAPEQVSGNPFDHRSDLFAYGALAYELLTGERYIDVDEDQIGNVPVVLLRVSRIRFQDRVGPLRAVLAPVDAPSGEKEALIALIEDLLSPDPELRPQNAAEVLERLEALGSLYRPHQGRRALAALVSALALEDQTDLVTPAEVGHTRIVESSTDLSSSKLGAGRRVEPIPGLESDPMMGVGLEAEEAPESARSLLPLVVAAVVLLGAAIGLLFLGPRQGGEASEADGAAEEVAPEPAGSAATNPFEELTRAPAPIEPATPEVPAPDATEAAEPTPPSARPEPAPAQPEPLRSPAPGIAAAAAPTPAPAAGAVEGEAPLLVHVPPKFAVAGSPFSVKVTLDGGTIPCSPRMHLAPKEGPYRTVTLSGDGGGSYSATVTLPYDEAHAAGVRYYLECCDGAACPARWKSASAPQVVSPPSF